MGLVAKGLRRRSNYFECWFGCLFGHDLRQRCHDLKNRLVVDFLDMFLVAGQIIQHSFDRTRQFTDRSNDFAQLFLIHV